MDLFDKIESHYQKKTPFVVYNKPDKKEVIGLFKMTIAFIVLQTLRKKVLFLQVLMVKIMS